MSDRQPARTHEDLVREAQRLNAEQYLERRENPRAALVRRAALLTPAAIVMTGLAFYSAQYLPGSILPLILIALCGVAIDIEAVAALRDLRAQPVTTRGKIDRLWKKSRYLFFGRVDYMLIGKTLFEVGAIAATELRPGDAVIVEHWPHTALVITLARDRGDEPAR
jgi:hypothetical protein